MSSAAASSFVVVAGYADNTVQVLRIPSHTHWQPDRSVQSSSARAYLAQCGIDVARFDFENERARGSLEEVTVANAVVGHFDLLADVCCSGSNARAYVTLGTEGAIHFCAFGRGKSVTALLDVPHLLDAQTHLNRFVRQSKTSASFEEATAPASCIALGKHTLVCGLADSRVCVFDATSFALVGALKLAKDQAPSPVAALHLEEGLPYIAVGLLDGSVFLLTCPYLANRRLKRSGEMLQLCVEVEEAWEASEAVVFASHRRPWEERDFRMVHVLSYRSGIDSDSRDIYLLATGPNGCVRMHSIVPEEGLVHSFVEREFSLKGGCVAAAVHPSKEYIALADVEGDISMFHLLTGCCRGLFENATSGETTISHTMRGGYTAMCFDPSGMYIASVICERLPWGRRQVILHEAATGVFVGYSDQFSIAFSSRGVGAESSARAHNTSGPGRRSVPPISDKIKFTCDGASLLVTAGGGLLRFGKLCDAISSAIGTARTQQKEFPQFWTWNPIMFANSESNGERGNGTSRLPSFLDMSKEGGSGNLEDTSQVKALDETADDDAASASNAGGSDGSGSGSGSGSDSDSGSGSG
eukprot:Rmarinus@m.23623